MFSLEPLCPGETGIGEVDDNAKDFLNAAVAGAYFAMIGSEAQSQMARYCRESVNSGLHTDDQKDFHLPSAQGI